MTACVAAATTDEERAACVPADNMFDAIVALDTTTGAVKWSTRALPVDAWNVACGIPVPGYQLWDHPSGDFCYSGAAAVNGALHWSSGYNLGVELPGQAIHSFTVNGR